MIEACDNRAEDPGRGSEVAGGEGAEGICRAGWRNRVIRGFGSVT